MRVWVAAIVGVALSFSQVATTSVSANEYVGQASRINAVGSFAAPVGFQVFCLKQPKYCRGGGAAEISFSNNTLRTLQVVNARVNRSILPTEERGDVWSVNVARGDCEDYVLTKRAALIAQGLPASALRIAAVRTRGGIEHAVLVVRTDMGDYVLDNLSGQVKNWRKTGHSWIAMSGANPHNWRKIV